MVRIPVDEWARSFKRLMDEKAVDSSGQNRQLVSHILWSKARALRVRYHLRREDYRRPEDLRLSGLVNRWWYYSVELAPEVLTKGLYPPHHPMLPRLMLRNCQLDDMECLDMGSMEGLIPVLMRRGGAKRVLATDYSDHCLEKLEAVKQYHGADFDYKSVGLMYDLHRKLSGKSFDLVNCSGLLYHVFSPMAVLAGVRPLLKQNGLMIVSTNVTLDKSYIMDFNNGGRLQLESNTFWYISVPLLDYLLRYLQLVPVDALYLPHESIQAGIRYVIDKPSGYLSVLCRAVDGAKEDSWMDESARNSLEYRGLSGGRMAQQSRSSIGYRDDKSREPIDLVDAVRSREPVPGVVGEEDSHTLRLTATT